jgi:hypothetical protein
LSPFEGTRFDACKMSANQQHDLALLQSSRHASWRLQQRNVREQHRQGGSDSGTLRASWTHVQGHADEKAAVTKSLRWNAPIHRDPFFKNMDFQWWAVRNFLRGPRMPRCCELLCTARGRVGCCSVCGHFCNDDVDDLGKHAAEGWISCRLARSGDHVH